ncbi:hypothetical protein CE91St63_07770 [[Clostridium] hylemonae]|nr:hypothetical protein CE91St63_07770 [[Clostridium] hylemonae]
METYMCIEDRRQNQYNTDKGWKKGGKTIVKARRLYYILVYTPCRLAAEGDDRKERDKRDV